MFIVRYGINWWTQSDTQNNTIAVVYLNEPLYRVKIGGLEGTDERGMNNLSKNNCVG